MSDSKEKIDDMNNTKASDIDPKETEQRARLIGERTSLIGALLDQAGSYDKWVLTLASGSLGLSLTFIEKIVPHPEVSTINILISAWSFLGFSILMTLLSFLFSQRACLKNIQIIENKLNKVEVNNNNIFTTMTGMLNWLSMISFLTGIALLIAFAVNNIYSVAGG
jgi:hypothetical protein